MSFNTFVSQNFFSNNYFQILPLTTFNNPDNLNIRKKAYLCAQ